MKLLIHPSVLAGAKFEEMNGSPTIENTAEELIGHRELKMAWADAINFCAACMASSYIDNGDGTPGSQAMQVNLPARWTLTGNLPTAGQNIPAGFQDAVCVGATYEPFFPDSPITAKLPDPATTNADNPVNAYEFARVRLTFQNIRELEEEINPGCEMVSMSAAGLVWDSDAKPIPRESAPAKQVNVAEWTLTRRWMPTVPQPYFDLINTVNDADIISPIYKRTFAAGTLMYIGPHVSYGRAGNGTPLFNTVLRFGHRKAGWHKFWRPEMVNGSNLGNWDSMKRLSDGHPYKQHEAADFTALNLIETRLV